MSSERVRWPSALLIAAILLEWGWHSLGFWAWGLPDPWPPFYFAQDIRAQVVDETGQPLKDVIVTANWQIQVQAEGYPLRQIAVMETVTDEEGRFAFPWWGPRLHWPINGVLYSSAPQLILFKRGYKPAPLTNDLFHPNFGMFRKSDWNGQTIRLAAFHGDDEAYAKVLGALDGGLVAFLPHSCDWRYIPRMLVAIGAEAQTLRNHQLDIGHYGLHTIDDRAREVDVAKCGSMPETLRRYVP